MKKVILLLSLALMTGLMSFTTTAIPEVEAVNTEMQIQIADLTASVNAATLEIFAPMAPMDNYMVVTVIGFPYCQILTFYCGTTSEVSTKISEICSGNYGGCYIGARHYTDVSWHPEVVHLWMEDNDSPTYCDISWEY